MVTTNKATEGEVGPGNGTDPTASGLLSTVSALVDALRSICAELCTLVVLETRLTVRRVLTIALSCVLVVLVLTTMWFGGAVALALLFMSFGIPPAAAVLGVVLLNLLALPFLVFRIKKLSRMLGYPATRDSVSRAVDHLVERATA
jgi:hypothetical protein